MIVFGEVDGFCNDLVSIYGEQGRVTDNRDTHFQLPVIVFGEVDDFSNDLVDVLGQQRHTSSVTCDYFWRS